VIEQPVQQPIIEQKKVGEIKPEYVFGAVLIPAAACQILVGLAEVVYGVVSNEPSWVGTGLITGGVAAGQTGVAGAVILHGVLRK